jgi:RNA polymerase sigma factor (TIGR02999 family)
VYPDLYRLARQYMSRERPDHTLQPSALVNEAYIRLGSVEGSEWPSRSHFFAMASTMMRRILVDYARERRASKRGGEARRTELDARISQPWVDLDELLLIDAALTRLATWDARQSRIVEMRFFGGMTEEEIAKLLDVSVRTVKRDWTAARAWLHTQLKSGGEPPSA